MKSRDTMVNVPQRTALSATLGLEEYRTKNTYNPKLASASVVGRLLIW